MPVSALIPPYGLSSKMSAMPSSPRSNFSTIRARYSPSCTVYVKGEENVAVGVIVGVAVMVDVSVAVDVIVGVKVSVGVGVSVANKLFSGLPDPLNQITSNMTPPKTSTPATI